MNAAIFRTKFTVGFKASQGSRCSRICPGALNAQYDHQRRGADQVFRLGFEVVGFLDDFTSVICAVFGRQAAIGAFRLMIRAIENFPAAMQCGRQPDGCQQQRGDFGEFGHGWI